MNKKKWLAALLIIGVLAIAFFWGGNYQKSPNKTASSSAQSEPAVANNIADHSPNEVSPSPTATATATATPSVTVKPAETIEPTVAPTAAPKATEAPIETPKATDAPKVATKTEPAATPKATPKATTKPVTKQETKKDKFLTDPVPSGKPKPVEWQDTTVDKSKKLTATLSVSAATILNNMDIFDKDKLEVLPADGIIYKAQKVTFSEGETVFDVLLREMKKNKIHMEFSMTPIYNSNYVEGINNLYEFDAGELSGWMYKVNGWFPNYGSSRYKLKDGDVIAWEYTCDLGRDVGGYVATGGAQKQ